MNKQEIYNTVYNYPTKNKEGYTPKEIEDLLKSFPTVDKDKFSATLGVHTVMIKDKEVVTYHNDIFYAIQAVLENRDLNAFEWD